MRHRVERWIILAGILLAAAGLRWVGINWDDYSHGHPDELFLTTIASEIGERSQLLDEVKARCTDRADRYNYFNTQCNPLNPNNIEPGSYAYGTLPTFIVRGAAEIATRVTGDPIWLEFDGIHLVGRFVNVIADLISVVMVFLIGRRLFGEKNGLLAAMLYAGAVLPIQLTHFWIVDIIAHMFFLIALYAAVAVSERGRVWAYVLFGLALGAGVASRVNVLAAAALAPTAALIYLHSVASPFRNWRAWRRPAVRSALLLLLAFAIGFITFRLAQPYAFDGPHWWNIGLNSKWLDDVRAVSKMSAEQNDGWPPSHQFVGRPAYLYPWFNMAVWGMGLLLGLGATLALFAALSQQIRQRRFSPQSGLLTFWIVLYFGWHGQLHFMTMRYYLPLYGVLCMLVAWWAAQVGWNRSVRFALVAGTFFWAFAFTGIYRSPQTRIEAAVWISDRLPARMTGIDPAGNWHYLSPDTEPRFEMLTFFKPDAGSEPEVYESLKAVVKSEEGRNVQRLWFQWSESTPVTLSIQLYRFDGDELEPTPLLEINATSTDLHGLQIDLDAEGQVKLEAGASYRWKIAASWLDQSFDRLHLISSFEWISPDHAPAITPIQFNNSYSSIVAYSHPSELSPVHYTLDQETELAGLFIPHNLGSPDDLVFTLNEQPIVAHFVRSDGSTSPLGDGRWYAFDHPVSFTTDPFLIVASEPLWVTGTAIATEGDWDLSTPTRGCLRPAGTPLGYHPFDGCKSTSGFDTHWYAELAMQVVEHDTAFKWRYMLDALLKADYFTISSNRMYDALPRNKRLFWYMEIFYSDLFNGELGYKQVARFESFPHFGPIVIPDQVLPDWHLPGWLNEMEAEEAFTVYDHPTVYVFQNLSFSSEKMPAFVHAPEKPNRVDLNKAARPTYVAPETAPTEAQIWRIVAGWAVAFILLGWLAFPLMFTLFPSLPLRGFGCGRGVAWLVLALVPWWLTALLRLPFWTRPALVGFVALFVGINVFLFKRRSSDLRAFVREHWRAMVVLDLMWLAAFGFGIVLRAVNPDYWHPWLGGEKMMDLAYLNAVWRTGEFPPPNPWLSGFSINYYYLGFVIVAMPLKLFRIAPEIAANLSLATLYATVFVQVFNLALALLRKVQAWGRILLAGAGTLLVMIAGNLGTLYLLVKPVANMAPHRWYWYPTRIIGESVNGGGGVINEVPLFSFLYGDLHAHIITLLPVTLLLMMLWAFVQQRRWWFAPLIGALISVIYMSNSWDVLVYVPLVVVLLGMVGRNTKRFLPLLALAVIGGLILVWPYLQHSTLSGYGHISRWKGERTLLGPFLLVWGAPLAVMAIWMTHRFKLLLTPDADSPVEIGLLILLAFPALVVGGQDGTSVLLIELLLAALALAWSDITAREIHLAEAFFLAGLLAIEHVSIPGDVDRMNTGFKVSFQLWLWIGLPLPVVIYRLVHDRRAYLLAGVCGILLLPGLLYPIKAIPARHVDSYTPQFTLNGYLFMQRMPLGTGTSDISIAGDADLIAYMRSHIKGYPVIAELYQHEYYWNSRIASYTGLPTVVGWQNHLRQQYPDYDPDIQQRVIDMGLFYVTTSPEILLELIQKYDIQYIVSGTLEQSVFAGRQQMALDQLLASGDLSIVYEKGQTRLYHVELQAGTHVEGSE